MMNTEVTPEQLESISIKFAKLMKLADSNDSPFEAENCLALASKLLWDSNLTESQLISARDLEKRVKRSYIKDGVEVGLNKWAVNYNFNSRDWKIQLLNVLAKNFFCRLDDGHAKVVTIVGEPKNIDIVKTLYTYVEKQIRASRKVVYNQAVSDGKIEYAQQRRYTNKPALSQFAVHSFKNSFASGAVSSIARRLEQQQKENVTNANEQGKAVNPTLAIDYGAALVAQIYSELDEAFYEFFPEMHPQKIAIEKYQRELEYRANMERLEKERVAREERIAAGLELPPSPSKPQKEYKRRGRRPIYRNTMNTNAFYTGRAAGNNIQIAPALKNAKTALNK